MSQEVRMYCHWKTKTTLIFKDLLLNGDGDGALETWALNVDSWGSSIQDLGIFFSEWDNNKHDFPITPMWGVSVILVIAVTQCLTKVTQGRKGLSGSQLKSQVIVVEKSGCRNLRQQGISVVRAATAGIQPIAWIIRNSHCKATHLQLGDPHAQKGHFSDWPLNPSASFAFDPFSIPN